MLAMPMLFNLIAIADPITLARRTNPVADAVAVTYHTLRVTGTMPMAGAGITDTTAGVAHAGAIRVSGADIVTTADLVTGAAAHSHAIAQRVAGADLGRTLFGRRFQVHLQIGLVQRYRAFNNWLIRLVQSTVCYQTMKRAFIILAHGWSPLKIVDNVTPRAMAQWKCNRCTIELNANRSTELLILKTFTREVVG